MQKNRKFFARSLTLASRSPGLRHPETLSLITLECADRPLGEICNGHGSYN